MNILKLNTIRDNLGAKKKSRPLGRGIGSGRGKTAGHGGKGQHGRSGVRLKSFEGGQTPLARRLPKRGFNNIFRLRYAEVSLGRLQEAIDQKRLLPQPQEKIDAASMQKAGLFKNPRDGVKILGSGKINQPVFMVVSGITESARKAIETLGGQVIIEKKKVHEDKDTGQGDTIKKSGSSKERQ